MSLQRCAPWNRTKESRYQLRLVEPQMEKDFSTPEALGRFFRAVYRGMGDPGTGSLQVDSDIAKNIGDQALPKIWTEAVCTEEVSCPVWRTR